MIDHIQSLLDREVQPDYRREATEHIAIEPNALARGTESAVIFRVHTEWLALSTLVFQGIADAGPVHSLPRRRDGIVLGITNVQGDLLVCVSLAALLGVVASEPSNPTGKALRQGGTGERLMIVKGAGGGLAFPVQEIHGVHRYRPEQLQEVPATLTLANSRYTIGMLFWNEQSVARLDDGLVFHAVSKALA